MAEILAPFSKVLECKSMYCDSNNTDVYALGLIWQYNTIVSGNFLASTRQQVITPIGVKRFHWCICALTLYNGCFHLMTSSCFEFMVFAGTNYMIRLVMILRPKWKWSIRLTNNNMLYPLTYLLITIFDAIWGDLGGGGGGEGGGGRG